MFSFRNDYVDCDVIVAGRQVRISGNVRVPSAYTKVVVKAPNPIDRMMSYTGSGLPFACPNMAFDNTPNHAVINESGGFDVVFSYPNSYYTSMGPSQRVPPSIFFTLERETEQPINVRVGLEDELPLKTLTHRPGRDAPEFYGREHIIPPQSAEGVMRSLAYAKSVYNIA